MPSGNPDAGQWTDGEGGAGRLAQPMGRIGITDRRVISDADPESIKPGPRYAQAQDSDGNRDGRRIDLRNEQSLGGHTIERHVGRSPEALYRAVRDSLDSTLRRGDQIDGPSESSFTTLEAANRLVNSTVSANKDKVENVIRGISPRENLDQEFSSPTGRQAYARNERSQIYIRDTHGVRVVIVRDRSSEKGFRVDTAFPTSRR